MAVQKPDIELLFGVKGGGRISGESGTTIQTQLAELMKSMNAQSRAKDRSILLNLDVAGTKKNFTQGLKQITDGLSGQKQFGIRLNIAELNAKSAIDKIRQELQTMLETLSVKPAVDKVSRELQSIETPSAASAAGTAAATAASTRAAASSGAARAMREDAEAAALAAQKTAVYKTQLEAVNKLRAEANTAVRNAGKGAETDEEKAALAGLKTEYEQLALRVEEFKAKKAKDFDSVGDIETERQAIEAYGNQVLENALSFKTSSDAASDYAAQLSKLTSLQRAAQTALGYTKAKGTAQYSAIEAVSQELDAMANGYVDLDTKKLEDYANTLKTNTAQIRSMGMASRSLGDIVTANAKKFTSWLGVSQIVMRGVQALRKMVQAVRDVDVAMTELRKVTDETESTYARFMEDTAQRTKELGATLADTINATADFARLGYGLEDAAELAKTAIIYKNVGDGIQDISEASASIISTMQAFGVAAADSMEIVDKFNAVGNNFAISSKGVGDALLRSASAMKAANNTLDETIALVTAANTVVQDADKVGTTMKTLSMFLRAAKTEAEEAGESTEDMANSVSELREELLALTGGKVDIQIDENTFKSTYQILKEMSAVWGEITDVSQANILELIGGKRNSNVVAAILNNFEVAENVLQTSANAAGSAMAENEKYLDSIAGKVAVLKATFEDFSNTFLGSDIVKTVVDLSNAALGFVNQLAKMKAILPIIAASFTTIVSIRKANKAKEAATEVASITAKLISEKAANEALAASYNALNKEQRKRIEQNLQQAVTEKTLTQDEYKAIAATLGLGRAEDSAKLSTDGLGASLKALFASNPAGWIITLLTLIPMLGGLFDSIKEAHEEEIRAVEETGEEFDSASASIDGYKKRVVELKQALADGTLSEEEAYNARKELLSIQDEVRKAYGNEAEAIDLVRGSADEAVKSLNGLTASLARENLAENASIIEEAVNKMEAPREYLSTAIGDTSNNEDVTSAIKEIVEKYEDAWLEFSDTWSDGQWMSLHVEADAESAKETLSGLAADFRKLKEDFLKNGIDIDDVFPSDYTFAETFERALTDVDDVISTYQKVYDDQIMWKIAGVEDYAKAMDAISDANDAFKDAVAADDVEALEAAIDAVNNLALDPEKIDNNGVRNYMQQLISDMQAEALKYTVNVKLSADVEEDGWTGRVKGALAALAGEDGTVTAADINNAGVTAQAERESGFARGGSDTQAWQALSDAAGEYGLTVDELIPILEQYGYITGTITENTNAQNDEVSKLKDTLPGLKSTYDTLTKAVGEMAGGGGLSSDTIQSIINELDESGENYADYLYEENGLIKLNTEAFGEYLDAKRQAAEDGGLGDAIFGALDAEALKEVFDTAAERVEKLHKALESLEGADTLDYGTFQELSELLPNVAGQITDVESAQAALTAAIAGAEDVARAAYGQMLYANQTWVSGVINSTAGLANALSSYYGKDASNWKDAAQNKWNVDSALVKDLSGLWAKYYNVSNQELEAQLKTVKKMMDDQSSKSLFTLPGGLGVNVPVQTQRAATTGLQKTYRELQALLEMRKAAEKSFSSLDFTPSGSGPGSSKSSGSSASSKTVEEYIADIDRFREALERLRIAQEKAEDIQFNIDNSDNLREQAFLSRTLAESYEREREALTDLRSLRSAAIEENAAQLRALGFEVSYNAEKDRLWISNLEHINDLAADSAGEYDSLEEATNAYRKEIETLISDTEEMNDENRENSDTFRELGQSVKDTRQAVYDYLDSVFDKMSETVDEMQSLYDQLHTAADEYAQSGYITIDTLQGILAMGPEYLAYLMDENGMLTINEEKIRDVIAARTQQMAVETALSYVEALHVANANGDIETLERLLYATEQATDATWGLVYANLELTGLDSAQKAAALERINAMRALADSAVQSIGQTNGSVVEDLQKMQDGLSDILKYVMEMIKHEIQEQIDAIERMKDAYSDYIDEKKEALDLARDEADYEKDKAKRLQEMAKLQARIDALSLDDSREAQAERAGLLEEMAELQDELGEKQNDKAIDTQKDALDQMDEDFSEAQDKKIAELEESISSEEKLYRLAIERIRTHWNTLYDELINWNTEYGTVLNQEITDAWENCLRAAQRYGDYVSAMNGIETDLSAAQSSGTNLQVGRTEYDSSSTGDEKLHAIIKRMYENGQLWHTQSDSQRKSSDAENTELGKRLNTEFGIPAWRGPDGVWYVGDKNSKTRLFDVYAKYTKYHTGGIVGGGSPKENEQFALLQKKEWVLTRDMVKNLTEKMKWLELMGKMAGDAANTPLSLPGQELLRGFGQSVSNVVNNDSHPIEIKFGDTVINGTIGKDALDQHRRVDRQMVNEIARLLRIQT